MRCTVYNSKASEYGGVAFGKAQQAQFEPHLSCCFRVNFVFPSILFLNDEASETSTYQFDLLRAVFTCRSAILLSPPRGLFQLVPCVSLKRKDIRNLIRPLCHPSDIPSCSPPHCHHLLHLHAYHFCYCCILCLKCFVRFIKIKSSYD